MRVWMLIVALVPWIAAAQDKSAASSAEATAAKAQKRSEFSFEDRKSVV